MTDPIRIKADVIPYTPEYSRDVLSWIDSEEAHRDICRGEGFPPPDDLIDSWQRSEVSSYLLFAQNRPVAYGELWSRPLELAVEIAHLVVHPQKRGRGYGTKMLDLLFQRAAQRSNVAKVILTLHTANEVTLGCYLKAGFDLVGTAGHRSGLRMVRMVT